MGRGDEGKETIVSGVRLRSAPWRPTEVQRRYRLLLDRAKDEPQMIVDTDDSVLLIQPKDQADFEHGLREHLAAAAQFHAVYAMHREEEPAGWAAATPYPWLRGFDSAEVSGFAHELVAYALDAAQRGTLENLEGNLRAWRSSAEIYEDPELVAHLIEAIDPDEIAELFPPSEQEAEAAEGAPSV